MRRTLSNLTGGADGGLTLWMDGVQQADLSGLDFLAPPAVDASPMFG